MTIDMNTVRGACMQSILCNHVVPIDDSELASFAGIVMPRNDIYVFLIWVITGQRLNLLNWWSKNRIDLIEQLNPELKFKEPKQPKQCTSLILKVFQEKISKMSDDTIMELCDMIWPDSADKDLA